MKTQSPKIVGITGGIGSGKTSVLRKFEAIGVPVYIADERAKQLMHTEGIKEKIILLFGQEAYTSQGLLNRTYLADKVFANSSRLKELNAIVHPAVREDFLNWVKKQNCEYVIYESALIFEHHQEANFDVIILVTAPLEQRIQRVIKRNKISREEVLKRINNQLPDEEKAIKSNIVINNADKMLKNIDIIEISDKIINNT